MLDREQLVGHVKDILMIAQKTLVENPNSTEQTGTINSKGDRQIAMDTKIEDEIIKYIKEKNLPFDIFSEEIGFVRFHDNPEYLITFDPLDGSTNFSLDQGKGLLPHGTIVGIFEGVDAPKLKNIVAAGALEFTRQLWWVFDGEKTYDKHGKVVVLSQDWKIDRSTPFYPDLFKPEYYDLYKVLPGNVFVRNTGSTIGNMTMFLSGVSAGFAQLWMKAEEISGVYGLVKGTGEMIVGSNGESLEELPFSETQTYPVLAGSKQIIPDVVSKLAPSLVRE